MDDINEMMEFFNRYNKQVYGVEPYKVDEPTVQELTISEMTGLPIKIKE